MKERIFKYLLEAGKGVAASRILSDVLNLHSAAARFSDKVLAGFIGEDPRFVCDGGLWQLRSLPGEQVQYDFAQSVVLHLRSSHPSDTLRHLHGAVAWPDGRLQEFTTPAPIPTLRRIRSEINGRLLTVWGSRELGLWNGLLRSRGLEPWRGETLYLRNLAARVLNRMPSGVQPEDLAPELGLPPPDEERPRDTARHLNACLQLLLDRVPAEHRRHPGFLREWIAGSGAAVDFSRFGFGPGFLRQLPGTPGIYIMKDREGTVVYVGKSRDLKRRVSSYFHPRALNNPKTVRIHERLHSIEVREADNEIEALLMETRMIRRFRPAVNLQTEIHETRAGSHQGRNLLLFVVGAAHKGVKIYFLCDGIFAGRLRAVLGRPPSRRLRERLQSLFFTQGKSLKRRGEIWEKEIVSRWFAANRKRLNYLDVEEAGDFASLLDRLQHYLCDPDQLARKVYYR